MNEISRWMIALGVVAASVGLTVLGMGMSYVRPDRGDITLGAVLMVGGIVAAVVGFVVYRATEGPDASV